MNDLHDAFDQLHPDRPVRGADTVLTGARGLAGQARLRRRVAVGAGALTVVAIVAMTLGGEGSRTIETDPGPVATDPTPTSPTIDPTATTDTTDPVVEDVPSGPGGNVAVYFSPSSAGDCSETVAVPRYVPGPAVLTGALDALLAGPTLAEQDAGLTSYFSAATADSLLSVRIVDGTAHVDLSNFMTSIAGGASTSCGSALLSNQLDDTVLQFPSVERTLYSFDGDVDAFYASFEGVPPDHYSPSLPGWTELIEVDLETGGVTASGFNELIDRAEPAWAHNARSVASVLLRLDDRPEGEVVDLRQEPDGAGRIVMAAEISGLGDDSIAAVRYLIVLADQDDGSLRFESGSWSQRCQPGRGHQDLSVDLCV